MKVIIAGSRTITNIKCVELAIVHSDFKITEVVSGTATGPDKLGERWAYQNKIPISRFPAQWKQNVNGKIYIDKSAGHKRNRQMGDYADALIAVWDGSSNGTAGMIDYMKRLKKPVCVYNVITNHFILTDCHHADHSENT